MKAQRKRLALCLDNKDYKASLMAGKVYRVLPDAKAAQDDLLRVIDESGEDYLYDKDLFVFVDFPKSVEKRIWAIEPVPALA